MTAWLVAIALLCALIPPVSAEVPQYSDTAGHWAEEAILRWSELGVLKGSDGQFRPNDNITFAELVVIVNRILGYPNHNTNPYIDVAPDDWYYEDVVATSHLSLFLGKMLQFRPAQKATRQQAFGIVAMLFGIQGKPMVSPFSDFLAVESYGTRIMEMWERGFVHGAPDGKLLPQQNITRAEIVTVLDNMIDLWVTEPGEYTVDGPKNVLIGTAGVTVTNRTAENIFIAPRVGWGSVTINSPDKGGVNIGLVAYTEDVLKTDTPQQLNVTFQQSVTVVNKPDSRFAGGIGSKEDPFRIETAEQLRLMEEFKNTDYFLLTRDLTLSGEWVPLSRSATLGFSSHLDGGGHTVRGLQINYRVPASRPDLYHGLFSQISGGSVRNLNVEGAVTVTYGETDTFKYELYIGGLAGQVNNTGLVENCNVNVSVRTEGAENVTVGGLAGWVNSFAEVQSCTASGNVTCTAPQGKAEYNSPQVGGLAGRITDGGVVSGCSSSATVEVSGGYYNMAGGLVGQVSSTNGMLFSGPGVIDTSRATGTVKASGALMQNNAGGLVGQVATAYVSECWTNVTVTTSGNPGYFNAGGGLAGSIYEGGVVSDCYALGTVANLGDGGASFGGLVGRLAGELHNSYSASVLQAAALTDFPLVGSTRSGGYLDGCFNLTPGTTNNQLSVAAAKQEGTYLDAGWDFETIWVMPQSGYPLPLLRSADMAAQSALMLPVHLN